MAGKRIEIVQSPYNCIPTVRFQTAAAATIIEKGMLLKKTSHGSPYVTPLVTTDHQIEDETAIVGLASNDSTHDDSGNDGVIDVFMPLPGIVYRMEANTPSNINTIANVNTVLGDRVPILISATTSAGNWTIDEDAGEGITNAFHLIGGNPDDGTLDFIIRHGATYLGEQEIS